MIADALAALNQVFSPPFRATLWKVLGLSIGLLVLVWIGLESLAASFITFENGWITTTLTILTGVGLFIGLAFLMAPVSSLVAGFFLDDMAQIVEREIDPHGPQGRPLPNLQAITLSTRFAGVSALVNIVALLLLLVPGVNLIAFFAANAYLTSREYFELAAMRYRPVEEARALRRKHAPALFFSGLFIAAFLAVPILNLMTPLFATALMVRLHRRLEPLP